MREFFGLIGMALSMILIVSSVLFGIYYVIDKATEDNYRYIDINNKEGRAINCYTSDVMYCRAINGERIKVVKYWIDK